ncbi:hypothetical protein [Streptomyces roseus]|uniref:IPT/TIG domain-containing protein n=1 Tax=Streptomyces roseus TaxID=66430 RepID=A0A0J6XKQ7_9ACTN|nr:hypothetical protein [Streptomyces roseus]KMO95263.1 hypothetical protein ACS04_24625 [Streptomyces roseus]
MYRRTRRAVVASLLVSSVVCGGAVALAPAAGALAPSAGAAAPAASCTVTPGPNDTYVTISGEGFTGPRKLNDGESTVDLAIGPDGTFLVKRFQKNVDYTVLAVNEDQNFIFVNCKKVGAPQNPKPQNPQNTTPVQPGSRRDVAQGRAAGAQAGTAAAAKSCATKPVPDKSGAQHSDAYWQAWTQAANRSFNRVCNAG